MWFLRVRRVFFIFRLQTVRVWARDGAEGVQLVRQPSEGDEEKGEYRWGLLKHPLGLLYKGGGATFVSGKRTCVFKVPVFFHLFLPATPSWRNQKLPFWKAMESRCQVQAATRMARRERCRSSPTRWLIDSQSRQDDLSVPKDQGATPLVV